MSDTLKAAEALIAWNDACPDQLAGHAPPGSMAISAVCLECLSNTTPEAIEALALDALHRQLGARGFADDDP